MRNIRDPARCRGCRQALAAAGLAVALAAAGPVPAAAFNLFAAHSVDVRFAAEDGKPMANVPVAVFAPGDPTRPVATGRTDKDGKFSFDADRDGLWTAQANTGTEIARATVRVGNNPNQEHHRLPPAVVLGGLFALLVIAAGYRLLRARERRR